MSKAQSWTLNIVIGACALAMLGAIVLSRLNNRLNQSVLQTQDQLNAAQQVQGTLQNLAVRVAQRGQSEPVLLELLKRHDLTVNLNVDGQTKQVP